MMGMYGNVHNSNDRSFGPTRGRRRHQRHRGPGPSGRGGWGQGPWGEQWGSGPGSPWDLGRGRPGPPPWVHDLIRHFGGPAFGPQQGQGFGQAGPGRGFGPGGHRRGRARRGDVRAAILDVLAGDEMNGYQLIQEIAERTGGAWKPSPGSVYPTVQQLEDEGLVEGREVDGRRLLRLTDAGRSYVEDNAEEMAATWAPFESPDSERGERGERRDSDVDEGFGFADRFGPGKGGDGLMPAVGQVMGAMWQIVTTGTPAQREQAAEILNATRGRLYRLLAEDDAE